MVQNPLKKVQNTSKKVQNPLEKVQNTPKIVQNIFLNLFFQKYNHKVHLIS